MKRTLLFACTCSLCLMLFSSCEKEKLTPGKTEAELLAEYEPMFRSYLPYQKGEQVVFTSPDTTIVFTVTTDSIKPLVAQTGNDFIYSVNHKVTLETNNISINFEQAYRNGYIVSYPEEKYPEDEENEEYIENIEFSKRNEISLICEMKTERSADINTNMSFYSTDRYYEKGIAYQSDTILSDSPEFSRLTYVRGEGLIRMDRLKLEYNSATGKYDEAPIVWTVTRQ